MTEIRGAVALVTGGASGIGRLTAERLLAAGAAQVALWDVDAAALARTAAQFGPAVTAVGVDLSDPADLSRAIAEADAAGFAPDILMNNAGIVVGKPFADHSDRDIRRTIEINSVAPKNTGIIWSNRRTMYLPTCTSSWNWYAPQARGAGRG